MSQSLISRDKEVCVGLPRVRFRCKKKGVPHCHIGSSDSAAVTTTLYGKRAVNRRLNGRRDGIFGEISQVPMAKR